MLDKVKGGVSVIVPVYNTAEYIEDCVRSLLNQSYKNVEFIFIDDGSPDNSVEIIEKLLSNSVCDYKIIHQKNKGLPAARNIGLKEANGEFVCFIDSDDIVDKNHIKILREILEDNSIDFSFSAYEATSPKNRNGSEIEKLDIRILSKNEIANMFLLRKIPIHCCAVMFRRAYLNYIGLSFNVKLKFGEDVEFLWRVISSINKCAFNTGRTYKYLVRPNSLMTNQKIDKIEIFLKEFKKTINGLSFEENYKNKIIGRTYFAINHSFAKYSEYPMFLILNDNELMKSEIPKVKGISDIRIRIMYRLLKIFPNLYWKVCKYV